jgi:hypothetical protein
MKRIKIVAALTLGCLFLGVIALALNVTMTGSGSLGGVLPGWSVMESCTPSMPGDSRGSVGSASFRAHKKSDSRFVADNAATLETSNGTMLGRIAEVSVDGLRADVSVAGATQFLNVDKTMPPIWWAESNAVQFANYGQGTGQVALVYGLAVDPADSSTYVASYGSVDGVERNRIIKFDADGVYVTEFGSSGSGDGQFGGAALTVAVSPVDGSVWVGDPGNYRIQKFNSSGIYQAKVGSNGSGNGQFSSNTQAIPLAVDSSGNVYVADRGNTRIQKFNSSAVYQSQVAVPGYASGAGLYDVAIDSSNVLYLSVLTTAGFAQDDAPGEIRTYDSSLVYQSSITPAIPPGTNSGIGQIEVDSDDNLWAHWFLATYVTRYDAAGSETAQWNSLYPTPTDVNTNMVMAATGDGSMRVMFRLASQASFPASRPYGDNYVTSFAHAGTPLSSAIQSYMEACDLTLNGWTLDYQAAVDPEVVFPGWSGNVWANLKELFATYGVEKIEDATTQTIIIRDIGSATTTFTNIEPATTRPVNLTGGRVVDVVYQQPRAGGGVVWDAETENRILSIAMATRETVILSTDNHPAELAQPVPTDTLPIQPGQYYVVDNTGLPVPAETWLNHGGNITLSVGASPGTISATFQGPGSNPSGFTGPYSFATGNDPGDTPALSIVGNGTFTTPRLFQRAGSQGQPFNSPFMDTVERVCARGHYTSLQDPNVVVDFIVPTAELPPVGQAGGVIFPFEDSRYRIIEVQRGDLKSRITAERWVTIEDIDDLWFPEIPASAVHLVATNQFLNPTFDGPDAPVNQATTTPSLGTYMGSAVAQAVTTSTATSGMRLAPNESRWAVSVGQAIYAVLTVTNGAAADRSFTANMRVYDTAGATLGSVLATTNSSTYIIPAGESQTITFNTTAPASAASVGINVNRNSGTGAAIGDTYYVDNVYLGAEDVAAFSGDTTDGAQHLYEWSGTQYDSTSLKSSGSTIDDFDTAWSGYSLGDIQIQPLRTA